MTTKSNHVHIYIDGTLQDGTKNPYCMNCGLLRSTIEANQPNQEEKWFCSRHQLNHGQKYKSCIQNQPNQEKHWNCHFGVSHEEGCPHKKQEEQEWEKRFNKLDNDHGVIQWTNTYARGLVMDFIRAEIAAARKEERGKLKEEIHNRLLNRIKRRDAALHSVDTLFQYWDGRVDGINEIYQDFFNNDLKQESEEEE